MSNIERDERVAARAIEGLYGMSKALKGGGHDDVVTVEAVIEDLASQLRGAVSDLQRIAVACDNGSDATSTAEFIRRVAAPYLHHAGGSRR